MDSRRLVSRVRRTDWDYAGRFSESPFSPIHFHPCRYVSQLPAAIVGLLSEEGDLVVDPFGGSGTTAVEAQRLRRPSISIDLNPIACLAVRAKTLSVSSRTIDYHVRELTKVARRTSSPQGELFESARALPPVPESVQLRKWYTKQVGQSLARLWAGISRTSGTRRILADAAFSAILLPACRETRHWGYVCDNTQPKSNRSVDVAAEFESVLSRLSRAYRSRDDEVRARSDGRLDLPEAEVICGDSRSALAGLDDRSVDLVVTSPPYFGVSDYIKAQRLSMEWFGLEIEPLRRLEIGARSKRHRTHARSEYLADTSEVLAQTRRVLRRGRYMVLVVGESGRRASVLGDLVDASRESGFRLVHQEKRSVSRQRRFAPSLTDELMLFFRAR